MLILLEQKIKMKISVELQCQQKKKNIRISSIHEIRYSIYADIESLIRKVDRRANNPEKSSTMKIGKHIPCQYSMSTIWGFDHIENKHTLYCGKDCMKKLCDSLKEHTKNIILLEKKCYC